MFSPIVLSGKHIQLEPIEEVHRQTLKTLVEDEKISTYSRALQLNFDGWFDKALKAANQMCFIVKMISSQEIVGSTRFYNISNEHRHLALGYTWYIPAVWGTVVNPECKFLLLRHAFDTLFMNRIEFTIDSRNHRSIAAVKKLGASEEGTLRKHMILEDGFVRDTCVFSIINSEWPLISNQLKIRLNSFV